MDYKIVEQPAFKIIGKAIRVQTKDGENMRRIPEFWRECAADGTLDRLIAMKPANGMFGDATLGVCQDFAADWSEFTYVVAIESSGAAFPEDLVETDVPALTWAVFEGRGSVVDAIQSLWGGIWSDFFPNSGYTHGPGPDIEAYPNGDPFAADYRFEVRVPVVKSPG